MMAMNMQIMARSLLVYRLTGSATILGAMAFAHATPMLLFSLLGGVMADRMQKKALILYGNIISVAVSLGVGLLLSLGLLSAERAGSWWLLVIASILQGTVMALTLPARQSIIIEIVGGEHLMNAVSLRVMGMNTMQIFASALTGFLIDAIGFEAVYYTMAGLYGIAAVLVCFMPQTKTMMIARKTGPLADLKEGIKYTKNNTLILLILCFSLFAVILALPYQTLMPIFADSILMVGATGMGILMSLSGIGSIVGSIILASLPNRKRGLLMLCSGFILGLALTAFSFSPAWHFSLIMIAMVGLAHTVRITLANILIQHYTEDEYRGRVMSFNMMEFGFISLGTFIAGLLTEQVGVQWALGSFGIILAILSIMAILFAPRVRKLN